MKIEIVSSKKRQILRNDEYFLIYIPISEKEASALSEYSYIPIDPCWRISVKRHLTPVQGDAERGGVCEHMDKGGTFCHQIGDVVQDRTP